MIAALALVLLFSSCGGGESAPTKDVTCDPPTNTETTCLIAGQYMLAGEVVVTEYNNTMTVTFNTGDDWEMTETHLHVDDDLGAFPTTKKGNPIPGQFEYAHMLDPAVMTDSFSFDKDADWGAGDIIYLAAHAVTWPLGETVASDTGVMVTGSYSPGSGPNSPVPDYAVEAWVHPSWWGGLTGTKPAGYTGSWKSFFEGNGAAWIWDTYRVRHPVAGDIVSFKDMFNIPGAPVGGTLYVTTDNGYEAFLNGTSLGSAQVHNDWRASDLTEPYCNSAGWQSVESWTLTGLLEGDNELTFDCANEQMNGGTISSNPGGLLYVAKIEYVTDDETAWGGCVDPEAGLVGYRFVDKGNWAMYFMYELRFDQTP